MTKRLRLPLALAAGTLFLTTLASAQALTEKTGIRFYEHHSSDVTGQPLGNGANGSKSGYDFVNQTYFNSFNTANMGAYMNGEEQNLDMVEHNGPFVSGASLYLGFTSGTSTIWGGNIKGNNTTKWMKAPESFDYASADDVSDLSAAYNEAMASVAVAEVKKDDVFIGRIRGGNQYVVIRCTATKIVTTPRGQNDNIYFEFDYKTSGASTGLNELAENRFSIFPNPAGDQVQLELKTSGDISSFHITDLAGREVTTQVLLTGNRADVSGLPKGIYVLTLTTTEGKTATRKLVKL